MTTPRNALLTAIVLISSNLAFVLPACAQTIEELQAKLEAQEQINDLLKQRIETLEAELAGKRIAAPQPASKGPERAAGDPEEQNALERIFVRRGAAVLPAGVIELTPHLFWSHSGGNFGSPVDNLYGTGLDARIGLAGGWMLGVNVPVLHRKRTGRGGATGIGDVSATVWKSLVTQDGRRPSLVASVRYVAPSAKKAAAGKAPLGSGFHRITGRLSSVKNIAPIAFFGDVTVTKFLGETLRGIDVRRSEVFGFGMGASLAVTPEISMSTGLSFDFEDELAVNGFKIDGTSTTKGAVEIGVGALLKRNLFLRFVGAIGITEDSPDVTLSVALPIRF